MSVGNDEPIDDVREVEVTMRKDETKLPGEVFRNNDGGLFAKLTIGPLADRPELLERLSENEQLMAVWVRITDEVPKRLLREGESLLAWVRVKQGDGKFVTKTTLFSLGAIAAVTVTRRAIRHYKSR